ncbi:hypothetical protein HNR19_004064 [Nocardioides thalensis]|uniref:Uncharacterized protein n=1 Tax=Nocardioides thalensis TaxID=1914755 RepID=A0A853C8L5_9ACTN|nr:hypothetical protein [Nocardioides thalensis]NYJ03366.1 hypothetical protein [Nocardioides thalensis]
MSAPAPTDVSEYRLSPLVFARIVGAYLIVFALLLLAGTALVGALEWSGDLLVVVLGVGVLGLIALSWWLRARLVLVRLTGTGYRVRMIRAAGVTEGRWPEVEDAVAATPRGVECVVLRLKDGRTTTIPVALLAADKDDFARDVRARLRSAAR